MIELSIIIVNWNSLDYVKACIESIIYQTRDIDYEIIVVDNASREPAEAIITKQFPKIKWIQSKKNLGFSGANNLGFRHSSANTLLFLNPDTEILGNALYNMYQALHRLSDAGVLGCKLLNSDLSVQFSCIQAYPTLLNQMLEAHILRQFFPKLKLWGMRPLFEESEHSQEVEVIAGACLMLRRDIFEQIQQFSEDYFMYSEDVDLCYKINKIGLKNYYTSQAQVIHHGGGSTRKKKNPFSSLLIFQDSKTLFLKKSRGHSYAQLYKKSMIFNALWRMTILSPLLIFQWLLQKNPPLDTAFQKWLLIFLWSIGKKHSSVPGASSGHSPGDSQSSLRLPAP